MTEDKRIAAKRKREQQVKKQKMIIAVVLVLIIAIAAVISIRFCGERNEETVEALQNSSVEKDAEKDAEKNIENNNINSDETEEERLSRVEKQAKEDQYPEGVIELLSKNPETVDFVENYGEQKNRSSAKEIEELKKGEIPHLLQWDARWGYAPYGTSIVAVSGCGPTCLSMVFSGLTGDKSITPAKMAEYGTEHHYVNEDNDTYWIFMSEAGDEWGITCREKMLDEETLKRELQNGNPVICIVGPGDFTQIGHFIVLAGYEDGKIIVHDPFSIENTKKRWEYQKIKDQIKSMWTYALNK